MECPFCQHSPLDARDTHCPACHRSLEIASGFRKVISVRQDVKENRGYVVGIKTGAIHGDVYADTVSHVEVYALQGAKPAGEWEAFLAERTPPYKFLAPYRPLDRALFHGREAQREALVTKIAQQPLLVLYGPQGVGKTSLLAAGVIPDLTQHGALALRVQDYDEPLVRVIRRALLARADKLTVDLPQTESLLVLAQSIVDSTEGTLALALDGFESLFHPTFDPARRSALLDHLAEALQRIDPLYFRVVIAVDSLDRLAPLQDRLPGILHPGVRLEPLTHAEAQLAIEGPMRVVGRRLGIGFYRTFVEDYLLDDLDQLTADQPGHIQPAQLQIVCQRLSDEALGQRGTEPFASIDLPLYRQLGRADGIMARYLEETLSTLGKQRVLAKRLLEAMAFSEDAGRVRPEQLPLNGATPQQRSQVLESLATAELLDAHAANGRTEYTFASPVVASGIRERAKPEVRRRYSARSDLKRVWLEWLAHPEEIVSKAQLRYLDEAWEVVAATAPPHQAPASAEQALLLLRSAVARDVPVRPWLDRFCQVGGLLVGQIETPDEAGERREASQDQERARCLLGLKDKELKPIPDPTTAKFGPVAWSAVCHPQAGTRQTAALALTALEGERADGLDRLREALRSPQLHTWQKRRRRAELVGTFTDAGFDPDTLKQRLYLDSWDRFGAWRWRAQRRVNRQRGRIGALVLGAGFGAGIPLGLFRALLSVTSRRDAGIRLGANLFWGFVLGAAIGLAIGLAEPLLVARRAPRQKPPPFWQAPLHPNRQPALLAVALGTVFFALAHLVVTWFNGVDLGDQAALLGTGALFGVGLNLGLYGQPTSDRPRPVWMRILDWVWRLVIVAFFTAIAQILVFAADATWPAATVTRSASHYRQYFAKLPALHSLVISHPRGTPLFDAVVVGILLLLGIAAGLRVAVERHERRQELERQAID